ncbi:uncharacterized protein LOC118180567, partial [Stegodyphus dumicola]|uniref:uncharacterized protein LOC118180567 n=1 Tax=Stegodyphus dumicola TaxID=202533 RepID=UPI0015AE479E
SDVDILRRCCLEFRAQFLDVAGVDPFQYVTIASACMATYRSGHIQPEHDCHGAHTRLRQLQRITALIRSGGWTLLLLRKGCFFHGCSSCYDGDVIHPLKGVSMATLREKTEETTRKLRAQGFHVIEMWEHEFQREKEENPDLQSFLDQHHLRDRLNPRDSFFGGRTNALKLFHEGDAKYVDFTSLYPWVNKYCVYPVGHPTIITESFGDVEDYFGIIQCRVIPPRNLYLPVLPYRCRKKLMFPLCRTCALLQLQTPCTHTDDERALVGTWVTEEVKLAKKKGYRVTHIYEVYHFQAIVYFSVFVPTLICF